MGHVVLYICFLKVPVGAKLEALEENIIVYLGTGCETNTLLYSLYTSWVT